VAGTRALAMARGRGQRGDEASALHLLGDIAARREAADPEDVERQLRSVIGLAEEVSMRPLVARGHLTLAEFYRRVGNAGESGRELKAAADLFRLMGMRYWLARAETEGLRLGTATSRERGDSPLDS
jgi:hypothetical protein